MANDPNTPELMRTALTADTFVEIFDALVDDFDVVDLLTNLTNRCVQILDVSAAGILLVADSGELRVMAASNEQARLLELFQIQNAQGPCFDSFTTGNSEAIARQRKAAELPGELAALYAEVRTMRRAKKTDRKRLTQILEDSKRFGEEALLRDEIEELLTAN